MLCSVFCHFSVISLTFRAVQRVLHSIKAEGIMQTDTPSAKVSRLSQWKKLRIKGLLIIALIYGLPETAAYTLTYLSQTNWPAFRRAYPVQKNGWEIQMRPITPGSLYPGGGSLISHGVTHYRSISLTNTSSRPTTLYGEEIDVPWFSFWRPVSAQRAQEIECATGRAALDVPCASKP